MYTIKSELLNDLINKSPVEGYIFGNTMREMIKVYPYDVSTDLTVDKIAIRFLSNHDKTAYTVNLMHIIHQFADGDEYTIVMTTAEDHSKITYTFSDGKSLKFFFCCYKRRDTFTVDDIAYSIKLKEFVHIKEAGSATVLTKEKRNLYANELRYGFLFVKYGAQLTEERRKSIEKQDYTISYALKEKEEAHIEEEKRVKEDEEKRVKEDEEKRVKEDEEKRVKEDEEKRVKEDEEKRVKEEKARIEEDKKMLIVAETAFEYEKAKIEYYRLMKKYDQLIKDMVDRKLGKT